MNDEVLMEQIRRKFAPFETEPYGDLALNANRAALIAISTLRKKKPKMTRHQKQVLKAFGILVVFKAVLYGSIAYAAKVARDANGKYQPPIGTPHVSSMMMRTDMPIDDE